MSPHDSAEVIEALRERIAFLEGLALDLGATRKQLEGPPRWIMMRVETARALPRDVALFRGPDGAPVGVITGLTVE